MVDFATIESCSDLTSEHAKKAASSSADIRAFLTRMTAIARPDEGCPKVLMAIARLVGQPWIEGDLRVELTGDETHTLLTIICEYGMGIRERLLPAAKFDGVPLDEFSRALELAPALALPLRVNDEEGKIILAPLLTPEDRLKSVPAPSFEMEDKSLSENERKTAPPAPNAHERPTPPAGFEAASVAKDAEDVWGIPIEERAKSNAPPEPTTAPPPPGSLPIPSLPLPSEPSALVVVGANPTLSEQPPTPRASVDWPTEPSAFTSVPPDAPIPPIAPLDEPTDELIPVGDDEGFGAFADTFDPHDPSPEKRPSGIRSPKEPEQEAPKPPSVHTRPTVRRMVAIDVAVVQKRDPRREED